MSKILTDYELAQRVYALMWTYAGTWGDMNARDISLGDIEDIIGEREPKDLALAIDEEIKSYVQEVESYVDEL